MPKFTEDMISIMEKSKIFILSTADRNGKPNGVPVGAKVISEDEILIVDYLMIKSRRNIVENPVASVTAWGDAHYGYQFKGQARVETSGEFFEKAVVLHQSYASELDLTVKAAVVIQVEEAYYVGVKDSGQNLF